MAIATTYIPAGDPGWVITAQVDNTRHKADREFQKRTAAPGNINRSGSTFIFATPCWWSGKEAWIKSKKADGKWTDVRAYDAIDFGHWIETNPAVGHWLAVRIGKLPSGLHQIEKVWDEWSLSTKWPMNADTLFLPDEMMRPPAS